MKYATSRRGVRTIRVKGKYKISFRVKTQEK